MFNHDITYFEKETKKFKNETDVDSWIEELKAIAENMKYGIKAYRKFIVARSLNSENDLYNSINYHIEIIARKVRILQMYYLKKILIKLLMKFG